MNSKRKTIITMSIIAFVLVVAITALAIVFASAQQTIKTTIKITYKAEDIDGTAKGTYTIGGVTQNLTAVKGETVLGSTLVFRASNTEDAGNLLFPEESLSLTNKNDNIVIEYTYTNTGDKHFLATMSFDAELKYNNMIIEYGIWDLSEQKIKYSESRYALVVPSGETLSYWIKISIKDKSKTANFSGDFNWLLEGCNKNNLSYELLETLNFIGENGEYSASYNGNADALNAGALIIPNEVNGDPVTSIVANEELTAEQKSAVTSVTIPASVTKIDKNAFSGFDNLTSVTFENPNNWYIAESLENLDQAILLNSSDLVDTTILATYMNSTYVDKYWVVIK